jgi:hypothetical protein
VATGDVHGRCIPLYCPLRVINMLELPVAAIANCQGDSPSLSVSSGTWDRNLKGSTKLSLVPFLVPLLTSFAMPFPSYVQGTISFCCPSPQSSPTDKPQYSPLTGDRPGRSRTYTIQDVIVENLQGKEESLGLDTSGFELRSGCPSKVTSTWSDSRIQHEYYPECAKTIERLTGAAKVIVFDHSELSLALIGKCTNIQLLFLHSCSNPVQTSYFFYQQVQT